MILGVAVDEGHDALLGVLHQTQLMAYWQPLLLRGPCQDHGAVELR